MKKKIFLTLGALAVCAGLTVCMPNDVYAANGDAGINTAAIQDGWNENSDGTYSYYLNGDKVRDRVVQIGSFYYGFDYNGKMYEDCKFVAKNDSGSYQHYRASETGKLYCNEWYQTDWGIWYYYISDCTGAKDIVEISGVKYAFDYEGQLRTNTYVSTEQGCFVANDMGVVIQVNSNGWSKVGDYWYYTKNGVFAEDTIEKIGSYYYGFEWRGRMISDATYQLYDSEKSETYYVAAREDGTLYQNQWLQRYDTWYYANANCHLATGLQTIGGNTYLFYYYGPLAVDEAIYIDDICYAADANGVAKRLYNGWNQVGKYWYYVANNQYVCNTIVNISGYNYAFDSTGKMFADKVFYMYDSTAEEYGYFRAKADGKLYRNEWYQDIYSTWYYYGNNSMAYSGLKAVNGKYYYFTSFGMCTHTTFSAENTWYRADGNGALTKLANNAWTYADGAWYYIQNNNLPETEVLLIDGKYYGFDAYGRMRMDEIFYAYDHPDGDGYYSQYCAKADGTLRRNEWHQDIYGTWFYFGNDARGLNGINTVDGKQYYFEYGSLRESGITYDNGKPYLIGKGGVLVTDKKGWYALDGEWYYMNNDGSLYEGFLDLSGKLYYLGYTLVTNSNYIVYNDALYQAKDTTGVLTKMTADGLYVDAYEVYYVSNGKLFKGWKYIQGAWRYFDESGYMVSDYSRYRIGDEYYAFDENGAMYVNTWIYDTYYATSSGALATGEYTIDGKKYIFSEYGYLETINYSENGEFVINGLKYKFKQGWNCVDGDWYYLDGEYLASSRRKIDGKTYYFSNYVMVSDRRYGSFYYGKDGAALTGWFKVDGEWYYADEDGWLWYGPAEIDGVNYVFDAGRMLTSDTIYYDTIYRIGTNGVVKSTEELKDGWNYVGVRAYYFEDGEEYTGWLGDTYIDDGTKVYDSKIYDSEYDAYYYIGKDGRCVLNKWIQPYEGSLTYYYAGYDGKLKTNGWASINGSWYYFDSEGYMETGLIVDKGVTYFLDHNGRLIKTFDKISDGWYQLDGEWLYAINGKFIVGEEVYIGGKFYSFRYNGCMETNYLGWRTFGKDGAMVARTGWYQFADRYWIYMGLQGSSTYEVWIEDNGNKYYSNGVIVTGYYMVDSELYYFDDNGVCKGKRGVTNGWYQADGEWYYFQNGKVVYDNIITINGVKYAFDYNGHMVTKQMYSKYNNNERVYYFFDANGAAVTKEGIYKTAEGKQVYVGKDGRAYYGAVYVNGKLQYMDAGVYEGNLN